VTIVRSFGSIGCWMRIPISFQRSSLSFCAAIFGWGGAHVSSTAIQRLCVCGASDSRGVATGRVISAAILRFSTYLDGEKWLLRKRQFSSRVVVPEVRKKGSAHLTIAANSPRSANDCESGRCSHFDSMIECELPASFRGCFATIIRGVRAP
jgi:hypothetical protein